MMTKGIPKEGIRVTGMSSVIPKRGFIRRFIHDKSDSHDSDTDEDIAKSCVCLNDHSSDID